MLNIYKMKSNLSFDFSNLNIYNKEIFNVIIKTINISISFIKKELKFKNENYFELIKAIENKQNDIKLQINQLTKTIKKMK